ncbi:MAG TPA: glycoside hydrolase family 32 protein [Draconibacterium sp.]|nr:glycoside hydrolase family 32 protein [Draconibacterium sp.]HRX10598.1 glycoside hydrolase family 32 protein [Draconibacterium sp.]
MKHKNIGLLAICLLTIFCGCNQKKESGKTVDLKNKDYYTEKYRPQFHFSPDSMWMNDPNGMVYYEGEYHLFYQYYPDSTVWGPMHWGHAVSTDLVHWEHLPIALFPDEHGYIFSGSAVVDWNNTSGLGKDGQPPLIVIFTYHEPKGEKAGKIDFQTQGIAYSNDKGRTWTKYGEPVLKNPGIRDFRDPKVSWYEDSKKWIMTLAAQDHIEFYSSPNLIDWKHESGFGKELGAHGGVWECPDLFQMTVKGTNEKQWVLLVSINPGGPNGGSATQYFIGDFDGSTFTTNQTETKWIDYGRDNYAGVTWSDIPESDGRKLFLGWMSNWSYATVVPTEKWRSATTLPRELSLQKNENGYYLVSTPVSELAGLRGEKVELLSQMISGNVSVDIKNIKVPRSEMVFRFQQKSNSQFGVPEEFGIKLSNEKGETFKIGYSPVNKTFFTDRTRAGQSSFSNEFSGKSIAYYELQNLMEVRIFVDEASVEVFVDNGKLVMTDIVFPTEPYNKLELYSTNGAFKLDSAEIWSLESIW